MPKRTSEGGVTSKRAPSAVSKVLLHPKINNVSKAVAASALTQRPNKKWHPEGGRP